MSLASWKKEFYKTPAHKVSERFALKHSLRKWRGLLYKNRRKHKVYFAGTKVYDDHNLLSIDESSCALCHHYQENECRGCPLGGCGAAYVKAICHENIVPMIRLLEKAVKKQKSRVKTAKRK